eukprot:TRINITY_DN18623_c1_g1_i1.p1 TRINITY_DN18623_c1_g1~~TRINITY_DN18623_c1_g1_i1.p1  ORF type:complete len:803 (-),score=141.30 TRINITY_DN18623_c1_g1_i1:132-2444(-)
MHGSATSPLRQESRELPTPTVSALPQHIAAWPPAKRPSAATVAAATAAALAAATAAIDTCAGGTTAAAEGQIGRRRTPTDSPSARRNGSTSTGGCGSSDCQFGADAPFSWASAVAAALTTQPTRRLPPPPPREVFCMSSGSGAGSLQALVGISRQASVPGQEPRQTVISTPGSLSLRPRRTFSARPVVTRQSSASAGPQSRPVVIRQSSASAVPQVAATAVSRSPRVNCRDAFRSASPGASGGSGCFSPPSGEAMFRAASPSVGRAVLRSCSPMRGPSSPLSPLPSSSGACIGRPLAVVGTASTPTSIAAAAAAAAAAATAAGFGVTGPASTSSSLPFAAPSPKPPAPPRIVVLPKTAPMRMPTAVARPSSPAPAAMRLPSASAPIPMPLSRVATPMHGLRFMSASASRQHPTKAQTGIPNADVTEELPGLLGVCDGVTGVHALGISPEKLPQELLHGLRQCYEDAGGGVFQGRSEDHAAWLLDIAQNAFATTRSQGATTMLVASLRDAGASGASLVTACAGDCCLIALRPVSFMPLRLKIVMQTEVTRYDSTHPVQVQRLPGVTDPQLAPETVIRKAKVEHLEVQEGDIVVMGSDGLFDNVTDADIAKAVEWHCSVLLTTAASHGSARIDGPTCLKELAVLLVDLAIMRVPSGVPPSSTAAAAASALGITTGTVGSRRGNPDDTTALVGVVVRQAADNEGSSSSYSRNKDANFLRATALRGLLDEASPSRPSSDVRNGVLKDRSNVESQESVHMTPKRSSVNEDSCLLS